MPLIEDGKLYNVAYLLQRDGEINAQYKIHITPHEQKDWVIDGGDNVQVFETDAGKVGILICYDSEFPELGRMLAEQGAQIILCHSGPIPKTAINVCGSVLNLARSKTSVMWRLAAVSATYRAWTTWTFNMLSQRCSHLQTFISPTTPH